MPDRFLKVQRVSLTLCGIAGLGLLLMLLDKRERSAFAPLTGFVFLAGLAGMFVQATGRQRLLAVLMNALLFLVMSGLIVTIFIEKPTGGVVLLVPVALVLLVLSALNVWFIARLPKGDGLEQT